MMEAIQLDLFDFVAMQTAVQSKVQEVLETIVPRNFQNDGRQGMSTTPAARIEVNFKAIRLLKKLKAEKRVPSHEEQITLSQFSGWGGLTEVFMENCFPTRNIRRRRTPFSTVITRPNISLISCGTLSRRRLDKME